MTTTPTLWRAAGQVNTTDAVGMANTQSNAKVVGLAGGGYVVAWEDDTDRLMLGPRDIIGQTFDALGQPIGDETILSFIYNDDDQKNVDLSALADGTFLVAYQTTDAAGFGDGENLTVERYDADGKFIDFDDFRGPSNDERPSIASFSDGSYALVYQNDGSGNQDLSFVFVDAAGTAAPDVTIENAVPATDPEIAALSSGNVAVVYQTANASSDVAFRIITPAGLTVKAGTVAGGAGSETGAQVSALASGFVVVWQSDDADGAGDTGIRFATYADDGTLRHAASAGNLTTKVGIQDDPAVTALADGGFLIAWRDAPSDSIVGQRFSAAGSAIGAQVTLLSGGGAYSDPDVALLSDGRFSVTATRTDAAGDADIVSAIWDPREPS